MFIKWIREWEKKKTVVIQFSSGTILNFSLFCLFNFIQLYNLGFFNKADLIF